MRGRTWPLAGALALATGMAWAQAPGRPLRLPNEAVLVLTRSVVLALDQANKTGNYTVLRALAAPGFAAINDAARLGDVFAAQRRDGVDLSGAAAVEPTLTLQPEATGNGMMRMAGYFPTRPRRVDFDLTFAPVDGKWRIFALTVDARRPEGSEARAMEGGPPR